MPKPKPEWLPRANAMVPGEVIVILAATGVDAITHHLRGLCKGHKAFRVRMYGDKARIELLGLKPIKKRVNTQFLLTKCSASPNQKQIYVQSKPKPYQDQAVSIPFQDDIHCAEGAT